MRRDYIRARPLNEEDGSTRAPPVIGEQEAARAGEDRGGNSSSAGTECGAARATRTSSAASR